MHPTYDGDPDAGVRRAWVTVHAGASEQGLGAGVVVAEGYLFTCAHVINAVLGRPKLATAEPTAQEMTRVAVSLPWAGPQRHAVGLAGWLPPLPHANQWWDGDLALLRIESMPEGITPVPIGATRGRCLWTWYHHGAPRSLVDVRVQAEMGPWYILDPGRAPLRILPGHSGAPLWDREHGCVTGLIVSTEPDNPRSYAIGASEVIRFLTSAGVVPAVAPAAYDARTGACRDDMVDVLDDLPGKKLRRCAERLGHALGLRRTPGTSTEVVDAALLHPRGVPTLLSALRQPEDLLRQLSGIAARLRPARLLTQEEYDDLIALLGPGAHRELRAAAHHAVPHFVLPDPCSSGIGTLIEDLEDRAVEPDVVPPLIQVVEEAAATRRGDGDALRDWSDRMTGRLGVSGAAARQCRWSAASRASARTVQPVLRVWLWASEPTAESYRYEIRLYDDRGNEGPVWTSGQSPGSRAELCARLSAAVRELDHYDDTAGVEFLLEEGFFGLAVDRLPTDAGLDEPRHLGRDRVVVLRGQSIRRPGVWKTRWDHGRNRTTGPYVMLDHRTADSVLNRQDEIALVIACCPPEQRNAALAMCRYLGVPVVLWHRGAHGKDAETALRTVVPQDWPRRLREEVRLQRAEAPEDTTHMGAHLALLWEDPSWAPPQQRLVHPPTGEGGVA
ncbi:trypsin-like peptidase domain-containing protein [Streptomyces sp. NPDC126510]|uniref:VMAP-C domain-containing protein n=1 Tax=Streptomyces sp. NPDC126510 TaxID=3155317 RepID=UPI0033193B27